MTIGRLLLIEITALGLGVALGLLVFGGQPGRVCYDGPAIATIAGDVQTNVIIGERRLCGSDLEISSIYGPTLEAVPPERIKFHMFVVD